MRNYKKLPICTIAIAAANVLIFLGLSFVGMTEDSAFMMEHGAMYVPYLMNGERYYTLITSMFLHFGFSHLMNNMVMLLVIGYSLEPEIGKIRFLIIYLGSGLMGNLVSVCGISRCFRSHLWNRGSSSLCCSPQSWTSRRDFNKRTRSDGRLKSLLWIHRTRCG